MPRFLYFYILAVGAVYSNPGLQSPFFGVLLPIGFVIGAVGLFGLLGGSLFVLVFAALYFSDFGATEVFRSLFLPAFLMMLGVVLLLGGAPTRRQRRRHRRDAEQFWEELAAEAERIERRRQRFRTRAAPGHTGAAGSAGGQARGATPAPLDPGTLQAYATLGIEPGATEAAIKTAYRRKIGRHHPDRLIAQGAPQALIDAANEQTRHILAAYETLQNNIG